MLIAEKLIPNFFVVSPGLTIAQFETSVSYGFVAYFNTSHDGSDSLYGFVASLDQLQVPFFISMLFGGDEQKNIIVAGIRIPLSGFFGFNRNKAL